MLVRNKKYEADLFYILFLVLKSWTESLCKLVYFIYFFYFSKFINIPFFLFCFVNSIYEFFVIGDMNLGEEKERDERY